MIDPLEIDSAISAREAEIGRLRHDLEIAEAELRGMKMLRDQIIGPKSPEITMDYVLKDTAGRTVAIQTKAYRAGRQPGAISKEWRAILADLYNGPFAGFDESSVMFAAHKHDINLKQSDARARMMAYKEHGYVEATDGYWSVTDFAAKKFGFYQEANKNEAPTREPEGAS
jgi:hypothetical protein